MLRLFFAFIIFMNFSGAYRTDTCDPIADYVTLAKADIENQAYDSALIKLACAKQYDPSNPKIFSYRGRVYFSLYQYPEAILTLTQGLDQISDTLSSDYFTMLLLRGVAYRSSNDLESALNDLQLWLETASQQTDPEIYGGKEVTVFVYTTRASIYDELKNFEQALADVNYAIELNSTIPMTNSAAYALRGFIYKALGKEALAQADWDKAKILDPLIGDYIHAGGQVAFFELEDNELAIENFTRAIRIRDEQETNDYFLRGRAYLNLKQYPQAIADFNTTLDIDPYLFTAFFFRGKAYLETGEYEKAIEDFTHYRTRNLIYPGTFYYRGEAYYAQGELENALKDYCAYKSRPEFEEDFSTLIAERLQTMGRQCDD